MVMERLEKALEHKASSVANRVVITATMLKVMRGPDFVLGAFAARHEPESVEPTPVPARLTRREKEVLALIVAGYSNQQIASELVITLGTAKRHISNIYRKLGVRSRTQAVAKAREMADG